MRIEARLPEVIANRQLKNQAGMGKKQQSADSFKTVGFADRLNSRTISTGEPTHHIEWFLGPSLIVAAQLVG